MVEGFTYHAGDYADEQTAFEAYRGLYAYGADVMRGSGPFFGAVRAWRFGKLIVYERRLASAVHAREERVESDGFDHFTLTFLLEGRLTGSADARRFALRPGEGVLLDMRRRMRTEAPEASFITVSILREVLEAAAGSLGHLHGRVLNAPAMGLLGDYLVSLTRNGEQMVEGAHPALARVFAELLSVALNAAPAHGAAGRQALRTLETAESFITGALANPDLNADLVGQALGLSRATLYRLFKPRGGVARFITRKRLDLIRRRLEAGDSASFEEIAKASGFRSGRAARQSFLDLERVDPDIYRTAGPETPAAETERARLRWAAWMGDF